MSIRRLLLALTAICGSIPLMGQTTFNGTGGSVPKNGTTCFPLTVENSNLPLDGTNGVAEVCFNISTSYLSSMDVYLVSPSGTQVTLFCCGNASGTSMGTYCFSTSGSGYLTGSSPSAGTYSSLIDLGSFNDGQTSTGVWELCVGNNTTNRTFTLNSWSITLGGGNVADPASLIDAGVCSPHTCDIDFYDNGGSGFNYSSGQTLYKTFCPPADGQCIRVDFSMIDIEYSAGCVYDYLDVYDGDDYTTGTYVGALCGSGTYSYTSTSGCLTFVFVSDGIYQYAGWEADITCTPCASTYYSSTVPANDQCGTAIPLSGTGTNAGAIGCDIDAPNPWGSACSWQTTENSVFYTFTVDGSTTQPVEITLENVACTGGANSVQMALYDNNCATVGTFGSNFHGCAGGVGNVTLTSSTNPLPAGTYILAVDGNAGADCTWEVTSPVLEVRWVDFLGHYVSEGDFVALEWYTTREIDNAGFEVQRSRDLRDWKDLGFVPAAADMKGTHSYQFEDRNGQMWGRQHYRLKQMDITGKVHYSPIVTVEIDGGETFEVLAAWPNPSQGDFHLSLSVDEPGDLIGELFDAAGRLLWSHEVKDCPVGSLDMDLPLEGLPAGIYSYRISLDGRTQNGKFILQR